ncbi:MAG: methyltransferase regulatory domain-containing protein, partial [Planctomycetales bacterium]|nr:methyltransferase regulatory domain-containing protein [Planctomycetales bacterium]
MPETPDPYGYNTIPYPAAPYPYSHPDHLAMLGTLLGLSPPDVNHCRILEIGCADGANLLPMALALPRSKCVGIDLADQQVTQGETVRRALGLANATLSCENLDTWEPSEPFDYIIAHGFYSWTPAATRDNLLRFIQRWLSPNGIAFVSYNVMPGWQTRHSLRQWLRCQAQPGPPATSLAHVRAQLHKLHQACDASHDTLALLNVHREVSRLVSWNDAYLRHDLLEDNNHPVTFMEFVEHVATHKLQFLCEADFASMTGIDLPPEIVQILPTIAPSQFERETLMDTLTQRAFRQSLVCHASVTPNLRITVDRLTNLLVGGTFTEKTSPAGLPKFTAASGWEMELSDPVVVAA